MEIDLAPAWLPDQVRIQGLDDPLAWHSSAMPSGATRLRVMLPASVLARGRWTLSIGATSTAPTGRGPLELPRVHPVGAAIVNEAWLAWVNDGTMIRPDRARGLAWIDPVEVPGLVTAPRPRACVSPSPGDGRPRPPRQESSASGSTRTPGPRSAPGHAWRPTGAG